MTFTIYERGEGKKLIRIKANHPEFKKTYGAGITIYNEKNTLFRVMENLTTWANNELKEAALFEIG